MTDNEIIKALECCNKIHTKTSCDDCPYCNDENCTFSMNNDTISLINRQKQRIKELEERLTEKK